MGWFTSSLRKLRAIPVIAGLCALLVADSAAVPGTRPDDTVVTLESMVANSELVIRGRVLEIDDAVQEPGQILTLDVLETLKGIAAQRLKVCARGYALHGGRDRGAELLLCLRPAQLDLANWQAELGSRAIIRLDGPRLTQPPVCMDLRPLKSRAEVLRVATAASSALFAADGSTFRDGTYRLYEGAWAEPLPDPSDHPPGYVQLPAGTAAVAWALDNARSVRPEIRALAMEVLGSLNAPGPNQTVLKSFLADPAWRQSGEGPWAVRDYLIRQRVYELLSAAGASVPHPITEGSLAAYQPVRWVRWAVIAVALGGLVVFVVHRDQKRAPRTTAGKTGFGLGFALAALLTVVIGYAWITSFYRASEIVVTAGSRHRVASYRGGLQYMLVRGWPESRGAVAENFPRSAEADLAWEWAKPMAAPAAMIVVNPVQGRLVAAQSQLSYLQFTLQQQQQIAPDDKPAQVSARNDAAMAEVNVQLLTAEAIRAQAQAQSAQGSAPVTLAPLAPVTGSVRLTLTSSLAGPFVRQRTPLSTRYWLGLTHVRGQLVAPDGSARSYIAVRVAYPWLFALPAGVTALSLHARLRRRRRIARGLCAYCGYDLRASRERCPECGTPMPQTGEAVIA